VATTVPVASPAAEPSARKRAERRFFSGYMIAIAAVIFVGFAPSFFLRGIVPSAPLPPLRETAIIHGVMATALVLIFPLQASLIAYGKRDLHIRLGQVGFVVAALMIPVIYVIGAFAYHRQEASIPPFAVAGLSLLILPLYTLALALAWRFRFDAQSHKRLMILVALLLSSAAVVRLPIWNHPLSSTLAWIAMIVPLWLWDMTATRRIHRMTLFSTAALIFQGAVNALVLPSMAWQDLVKVIPGYGIP